MNATDHLNLAKEDLAIAESADAKREAYKRAAEHITVYKEVTKETNENISIFLGCSSDKVAKLLRWQRSDFEADTPYLMDEKAPGRARRSHTKKLLREEPEAVVQIIEEAELTPDVRARISRAVSEPRPKNVPPRSERPGYIDGLLSDAQNAYSKGNFTVWKIMEELADQPSLTGEDQIRRLSKVDGVLEVAEIGPRIAATLRGYIDTGRINEDLERLRKTWKVSS